MRVALITFLGKKGKDTDDIVRILDARASGRGAEVEVFDGFRDLLNTRLTAFDYIAVLVQSKGLLGGPVPGRVAEFLDTSGAVSGKKGCALVLKSGLSASKTCRSLMDVMERAGIMLDYFGTIANIGQASSVGSKIG